MIEEKVNLDAVFVALELKRDLSMAPIIQNMAAMTGWNAQLRILAVACQEQAPKVYQALNVAHRLVSGGVMEGSIEGGVSIPEYYEPIEDDD